MKTFILLSAIAGSGKSTWAEEYRLTHPHTFIVSSDTLRKELGGAYQNFEHEEEMWDRFKKDILKHFDAYDDVTVIADATNVTNSLRLYYAKLAEKYDKKILVIFKKDKSRVLEENRKRIGGRIVPDYAIDKMFLKWEDVNDEVKSSFDEVKIIDYYFDAPHVKSEFHYK